MGKAGKKVSKRIAKDKNNLLAIEEGGSPPIPPSRRPFQPMTPTQGNYRNTIIASTVTFGIGPAGTGKSFVVGAMAAEELAEKRIERLIVTRPAVEAAASLGFLPGEEAEKYEPYFRPFRDILERRLGASMVEYMVKTKKIEAVPLNYMRGMTFEDCWVVLDEAQNATPKEMMMFLTRIGEGCKVIINGDPSQKDIRGRSGLVDAIERLDGLRGVGCITFTASDIVRSGIVREIIERYNQERDDSPDESSPTPWKDKWK